MKGSQHKLSRRIGFIIRAYRLNSGLTQENLAVKAGVTQGAVSHVEQGLRSNLETLERISLVLGKTLGQVIARAENIRDKATLKKDLKRRLKKIKTKRD